MSNPSITELAEFILAAPPRAGGARLVLIDGPAGAGKTTLAHRIAGRLGGAQVLHADDMYEGWEGLDVLWDVLGEQVLLPLSRGERAGFRRWDWVAGERAERIEVPAAEALVIEGVGSAQAGAREFASAVIYVEAPWETRLARGLERDGEAMRTEWERWEVVQNRHLAEEDTRASADFVVDGTAPVPEGGPTPD